MKFTQHVVIEVPDEAALVELMKQWKKDDVADSPGFLGGRLLRFRDRPGRYVIQADFESWDTAEANNDRPETQRWATRLADLIDGDTKYENLDVLDEF
jgi:quinol monooxygenase YgiN